MCDNILGPLLKIKCKTKAGYNARMDITDLRPRILPEDRGNDRWYLKPACYNLSMEKTIKFLLTLKTPSSYSADIKSLVDMAKKKQAGMKSHDCHVMMTQKLLVAIRNILLKDFREILPVAISVIYSTQYGRRP